MPWKTKLPYLLNQNVGVSLANGQGVAGKLCNVDAQGIELLEYLYQTQFATKRYSYGEIRNVSPYPACHRSPVVY